MKTLLNKAYYVDQSIRTIIEANFELIASENWYILYKYKVDQSYWRLDKWDKNQVQFFVKLESNENWTEVDTTSLKIELLKQSRGTTKQQCLWKDCENEALSAMKICAFHAFTEMGIRK
ncbi:hypothetical protein [Kordia jejudonensis]|uniref:hypothetical protein n=1 Tax=Kordia jejudonensis TaxID=1348245 RepID=UPI00062965F8|nr:hypothetical protein [Kordia jejudonensis]